MIVTLSQALQDIQQDHTRHHVKGVDYPAVVPNEIGRKILRRDLSKWEGSVRGKVVQGLTRKDLELLDIFEGDVGYVVFTQ